MQTTTSETVFPVRYAETDQMGVVHHSVYPVWFECGRTEFVQRFGVSYAEVEQAGAMLPLLRLTCEYRMPLVYGQTAIVRTRLILATKTRLTFGYAVYDRPDGPVCATGTTEHAWTDKRLRPVNLSRHLPELFERLAPMYGMATGE